MVDEAYAITAATGYGAVKYHSLVLTAWRGDDTEALRLIETAGKEGTARGEKAASSA